MRTIINVYIWDARVNLIEHSKEIDVSPDMPPLEAMAQAERIKRVLSEQFPERKIHVDVKFSFQHEALQNSRQITRDAVDQLVDACTV